MALPIKETPVLTGKEAHSFDKWLKENQNRKVSPETYQRIKAAAKKFKLA